MVIFRIFYHSKSEAVVSPVVATQINLSLLWLKLVFASGEGIGSMLASRQGGWCASIRLTCVLHLKTVLVISSLLCGEILQSQLLLSPHTYAESTPGSSVDAQVCFIVKLGLDRARERDLVPICEPSLSSWPLLWK